MNKKVLIITYYWPPSGGSGVQRWLKFAKYLPVFGWEPIVLTVDEKVASYPQVDRSLLKDVSPKIRVEKTTTFEILDFYKRISPEKEVPYGGFTDEKEPSAFQKLTRFIRGNFFLPDPRRGWNRFAYKKACELIETERIETIITTSPPHSSQLIGLKLKRRFPHLKWVADLRDPWTDIHYYKKLYPTFVADAINKAYEKTILEHASTIIVTCQATKNTFLSKSRKIDENKIHVITNGFDTDDFISIKRNLLPKFTITYIGILYNAYDLRSLLAAFSAIQNKEECCLRFVGHSSVFIANDIEQLELEDFTQFVPHVPHADAIQLMTDSSVLVLLVPDKEKESSFLPGKLFEYLAARRPILCIAPADNEIAKIIAKCEAGRTFDYNDIAGISSYLEEKREEWKQHHICELQTSSYLEYSREELTKKLIDTLES